VQRVVQQFDDADCQRIGHNECLAECKRGPADNCSER
jgi:hypothetical protein